MLTVLMPVYGREAFTLRFMRYWDRFKPKYSLLIAKEQSDNTIKAYHRKMLDAVRRIETPYTMLADNDDFLGFHGISRCLARLEWDKETIAARGRQVTFRISPLQSPHGRIHQMYWREPIEPCPRLRYSIFRTPIMLKLWEEICLNTDTLGDEETYFWTRAASLGQTAMSRSFITYYSQAGTGASYRKTWRRHLRFLKLRPRFYVEHTKRRLLREINPSYVPTTIDELKAIDQCLQPTSG